MKPYLKISIIEVIDYLLVSVVIGIKFGVLWGLLAFGAIDILLKCCETMGRGNVSRKINIIGDDKEKS